MSGTPLVSVILPCFEHRATLPWALASLLAQTHAHWQCIVVDDGSTDAPGEVVEAFGDPRITYVRQTVNRGPAAARQLALERTSGAFVVMQDADDWSYPDRLEVQLAHFRRSPGLAAVGCGMAIVDGANRLRGVRGSEERQFTGSAFRPLPASCGHPTLMLHGDLARSARYDPELRQGEDSDYLGRVLDRRAGAIAAGPHYAYRQDPAGVAEHRLRAHRRRRLYLRKLARELPLRGRALLLESHLKAGAYAAAHALGLDGAVARLRTPPASEPQRLAFAQARERVAGIVAAAGLGEAGA